MSEVVDTGGADATPARSEPDALSPRARRFELRISLSDALDEEHIVVTANTSETVGDLLDQAELALGKSYRGALLCHRRGRQLVRSERLDTCGIRWGDVLTVIPESADLTAIGGVTRCELIVVGGPNAGSTWMLGDGEFLIGRDVDADVRLADPSLSREHARLTVGPHGVSITDLESSNGVAVEGRRLPANAPRQILADEQIELGRSLIRTRPTGAAAPVGLRERDGLVEFNRQPRVKPVRTWFTRRVSAPPTRHGKVKLPLIASLVPLIAGIAMFLFLKSPYMLAFAALGPVMAVGSWFSERRSGNKGFRSASTEFRTEFADALEALDGALTQEVADRRSDAPDLATLMGRASTLDPALWERRTGDPDFLSLRVGVGDLPAHASIELADGGDRDLRKSAVAQISERRTAVGVPLQLEMGRYGTVGVVGPEQTVSHEVIALALQAACLHSPADLVILGAFSEREAERWSWLRWLPHVGAERLGLERAVAVGETETTSLLTQLRDLSADRKQLTPGFSRPVSILLLLDEAMCHNRSLLTGVLTDAESVGIHTLWMGREARNVPGQAGALVENESERFVARITDVGRAQSVADVSMDGLDPVVATQVARGLAPVRDISESSHSGDVPRRAGLLDLLDLAQPTPEALTARWAAWDGGLTSTVGITPDGPLRIDLRAEGPHALIAGTTGSGKSELLRTFVASAAAQAPPDRLNFLLIDYKGGSAFAPCRSLPHVVDVVSDLDDHLAERALVSLNAELKRRERLLAEHGARDLLELQRRLPELAPPMLVIAVDEFAKLREEVPEFVDGVVDIAQRGRSLGVHMVLAAQTLRNAFTPAIRANTNLRIALRVADDTESDDVVGSPIAARIPSGPRFSGRAFARTGYGELREFQTAYVSGKTAAPADQRLAITRLDLSGSTVISAADAEVESDTNNDLVSLGAAALGALVALGIPQQGPPWQPPLPDQLAWDARDATVGEGRIVIGAVDLPEQQRQDPLVIDLPEAGHVAVFGGGGAGKSGVLKAVAHALAESHDPDDLRIFALDAGGGALESIDQLPHCGGVVRVDDTERVDRLFRELVRRTDNRSEDARTVLLLDDLGAFQAEHDTPGADSPFQCLQRVLAAGRAARVHVILTASRRAALTSALGANVGQRLILRMSTEEDLLAMGLEAKRVKGAKLPPGAGFTADSREFRVALAPTTEVAAEREPDGRGITRIMTLPQQVSAARVGEIGTLARVPIGLADADLGPAHLALDDGHAMIVGPYRSGRSTALVTLANALAAGGEVDLYLLSPRRSPLRDLDVWKARALGVDECTQAADGLLQRLNASETLERPAVVIIDDAGELGDPGVASRLERVVKLGRDRDLTVVAAAETSAARGVAVPWIRELRKDGVGLLLQPDLLGDGDLLGVKLPRRVAVPMIPGRGFLVSRGRAELIQVANHSYTLG